jgi:hypothetical protein
VKLSSSTSGRIYGRLVWRGKTKEKDVEIRGPLKKEWKLLNFPAYRTFSPTTEEVEKLFPRTTI